MKKKIAAWPVWVKLMLIPLIPVAALFVLPYLALCVYGLIWAQLMDDDSIIDWLTSQE